MNTESIGKKGRKRSGVISFVGGLVLLVLALSVFAVASQARTLSSQAEESVRTVENLRVVSLARSELGVASRLAEAAPERLAVIEGALDAALSSIDSVEANLDSSTDAAVREAFTVFRLAADNQAVQIRESIDDLDALQQAELDTGESFAELAEVMRAQQVASFEGLEADNELMNLIATISTFIVAFIVPSVGMFIFRALRAAPREHRRLELDNDRLKTRSLAMATAVATDARELRDALRNDPDLYNSGRVSRALMRFENVASLNGAPTKLRNVRFCINDVVEEAVAEVDAAGVVEIAPSSKWIATADQDQFQLAVTEVISNALSHGSTPVRIAIETVKGSIEVHVVDNGPGLLGSLPDAVIEEREFDLRENIGSGTYGFGLITARSSLEAMGGELRYEREGTQTKMVLSVPMSLASMAVDDDEMPKAA